MTTAERIKQAIQSAADGIHNAQHWNEDNEIYDGKTTWDVLMERITAILAEHDATKDAKLQVRDDHIDSLKAELADAAETNRLLREQLDQERVTVEALREENRLLKIAINCRANAPTT